MGSPPDRDRGSAGAGPAGAGELVTQTVTLPSGDLRLLQPQESAELPDDHAVEWAPLVPYGSVLWRSGVALARELDPTRLRDKRVVELGCGLAVPSLVAARAGADVLATDADPEVLALVADNARLNQVALNTARVNWARPQGLVARGRFDLVLAADVLYERPAVRQLLDLLPRLAGEICLADPGRPPAEDFLEQATSRWRIETRVRGVVRIYRLRPRR